MKNENLLNKIVYGIQIVTSLLLVGVLYYISFIPLLYIIGVFIVLVGLLVGEYFLIFYKKKEHSRRSLMTKVISLLLSIVMLVGSFMMYQTGRVVDLLGDENFQTRAISVIVLDDSSINNENQLPGSDVGYVSTIDEESMEYAVNEINTKVGTITLKDYGDFHTLVEGLYNKEVDAIILDEAFRTLVDQDFETFDEDTRVIYQVLKDEGTVSSKSVEVTENPFLIYISGNDQYGEVATVSRSDVNMLAAVNPVTKQILLISIPRDTYYPLHRNGQYDKFTHAGLYGLQESIDTLQDMMGEEINYYVQMNFTSFINIVDALGGITVNSPIAFTTVKGNYEIKEGENTLNAAQALSFVRERKAFAAGDFERGKNQQRMISAIIKKVCSPAILTSYSSILNTVSESVETNFSSAEMNALVSLQLSQMINWDIQSYQITGTPASKPCYSVGNRSASVVEPYQTSIKQAQSYIDDLMAGKTISTEDGDLDTSGE